MKNSNCSIIKDLIPNYIEDLVSDETKEVMENHINTCNECRQILQMAQKEQKKESITEKDNQVNELKYLKRYERRRKVIKTILCIVALLCIISIIFILIKNNYIKSIILTSYQRGQELKSAQNYRLSVVEHNINYNIDQETFFYKDYYYKDNYYKEAYITDGVKQKIEDQDTARYGSINSNKQVQINNTSKKIRNVTSNYTFVYEGTYISEMYGYIQFYTKDYGALINLIIRSGFNSKTDRFNGQECYVLRRGDKSGYYEIWISKDTKLPIREVNEIYGVQYTERTYSLFIDVVTDEDVKYNILPEYTVENVNEFTK